MPTLHIHLDEAGNWTFGRKGSRYLVITAAWTYNPRPLAEDLASLRYSLTRSGKDIEAFHAAPDAQATRDAVIKAMMAHNDWSFAAVLVEKCKVNPAIHEPTKFYPRFASILLKFILRGRDNRAATNVLVYADNLPMDTRAKREGVLKAIKQTCVAELPVGCPYHVFSHCHQSNKWIQVADYCCWAIQRRWERGDRRTYDQVRGRLAKEELEVTAGGDGTVYY